MNRHIERKHKYSKHYTGKKQRLISNFEKSLAKQRTLRKAVSPSELGKLASYKLAFTIARHMMQFSSCEALLGQPILSRLFKKNMASSQNTIASRTLEHVVLPELTIKITKSPFLSVMADDSTDSAVNPLSASCANCNRGACARKTAWFGKDWRDHGIY